MFLILLEHEQNYKSTLMNLTDFQIRRLNQLAISMFWLIHAFQNTAKAIGDYGYGVFVSTFDAVPNYEF